MRGEAGEGRAGPSWVGHVSAVLGGWPPPGNESYNASHVLFCLILDTNSTHTSPSTAP